MKKKLFFVLRKSDRGVALVEFALVTPVLIFLIMGILEFGWLFSGWITITSAAREGARVATVKSQDDPGYQGFVLKAVTDHAATLDDVSVNTEFMSEKITGQEFDSVKVTAEGSMEPLVKFYIKSKVTLTGEATMRLY